MHAMNYRMHELTGYNTHPCLLLSRASKAACMHADEPREAGGIHAVPYQLTCT
jgi:hypothetical protein